MPRPAVPPTLLAGWGVAEPAAEALRLGAHRFAVADEAMVLGRLVPGPATPSGGPGPGPLTAAALAPRGEAMVSAGALALEVAIPEGTTAAGVADALPALVASLRVPVVVATGDRASVEAAVEAGASGVLPTAMPSAALLAALGAAGATVLLPLGAWPGADPSTLAGVAGAAAAAGVHPDRLLLDVVLATPAPGCPGLPILASDPPASGPGPGPAVERGATSAWFALAIARGARLLRTASPGPVRRTSVALAAIRQGRRATRGRPA